MRRAGLLLAALPFTAFGQTALDLKDIDLRIVLSSASRAFTARATYKVAVPAGVTELFFVARKIAINAASVDGAEAATFQQEDGVRVVLPEGAAERTIVLAYESRPLAGVIPTLEAPTDRDRPLIHSDGTLAGIPYWLPLPTSPGDLTTSTVDVVVPKAWQAVATGAAVERKDEGYERFGWIFRERTPFPAGRLAFAAGPLTETVTGSTPPVSHWTTPALQRAADARYGAGGRMVAFFSRYLDQEAPFGRLAFVTVPDGAVPTGVAAGVVLEREDRLGASSASLAEAVALQWLRPAPGGEGTVADLARTLRGLYLRETEGTEAFDADRLDSPTDRFRFLHRKLGDERFRRAVVRLLRDAREGGIDEATAKKAFLTEGPTAWDGPSLATAVLDDGPGGRPRLRLNRGEATVVVDGKPILVKASAAGTLLPPGKRIVVDPGAWQVVAFTDARKKVGDREWADRFYYAEGVAGRARAIADLPPAVANRIGAELAGSVRLPALQARVVERLRSRPEVVLPYAIDADPGVRAAALARLGPAHVAALEKLLPRAPSPAVRADVERALLRLAPTAARAEAAWRSGDEPSRVPALEAWSRIDPVRARDEAFGLMVSPPSRSLRAAAALALGQVKDLPGERRVLESLLVAAREPTVIVRTAAVTALGEYGSAEARELLLVLKDHPIAALSRAATESLAKLPG